MIGDTVFDFETLEKDNDSWHGPALVIGADGDVVVLGHGGSVRRVPLLHCRPVSAVLGSPDVDPEVPPVARTDEAWQELEELLVDEAGKELRAEEIAELRRVRDDREPVVTSLRARAAMFVLTEMGPGIPELIWQGYASVIPPAVSGEVLLSYCDVAHRSARRGMSEVTPERAQLLEFVVAKQKELASWVACHVNFCDTKQHLRPSQGPTLASRWSGEISSTLGLNIYSEEGTESSPALD